MPHRRNAQPTLAVIMDPLTHIQFKKDTTLALMFAAQERGWRVLVGELPDLFLDHGKALATLSEVTVQMNPDHWFDIVQTSTMPLGECDALLMRKDPPFDSQYIYATYILEQAEREGCVVVNRPQSLRDCNEKVFATQFPQCCPPLLVSQDTVRMRDFHRRHGDVIFKPLDGMGGSRVFRCKGDDPNVSVILETLTDHGKEFIMAQKYIPEISAGDKRILVVDGTPIPFSLARTPARGETRGNLAAGGRGVAQPLSERDAWIVQQVAPTLVEKGLLFVGLDVIGDYLTEINVTSPTCVREIDAAHDTRIGDKLMAAIEAKLPSA